MHLFKTVSIVLSTLFSLALVETSSPNPVKRQDTGRCERFEQCRFVNSMLGAPMSCRDTPTGCCNPDMLIGMAECYRCYYRDSRNGGTPVDMSKAQLGVDGLYNNCLINGARIPVPIDVFTLPGQAVNRDTVLPRRNVTSPSPGKVSPPRSTITVFVDPTPGPGDVAAPKGSARALKMLPLESLSLVLLVGIAAVMV